MNFNSISNTSSIDPNDIKLLRKIKKTFANKVNYKELPKIGASLENDDIWLKIVTQFCVMGGAKMIDKLQSKEDDWKEFQKEISLNNLLSKTTNRYDYIVSILKNFKATRFHPQQATKINKLLENRKVINNGRVVLLENLSHGEDFTTIREKLIRRNPYFKLKSTSDFMISTGLSHDVIALDTRIVGILLKHFGLNVDANKVQGNKKIYISIEQALREACKQVDLSLAHLDRILFKFSEKNAISFVIEDL